MYVRIRGDVNIMTRPIINHCSERANWARSGPTPPNLSVPDRGTAAPVKSTLLGFSMVLAFLIELPHNLNEARENIQVIVSVS